MPLSWSVLAAVGLGSAFGGVFRLLAQTYSAKWVMFNFPVGTLLVNVVGCFFAGFLFMYWQYEQVNSLVRSAALVGFLGALTTFSAFSLDTFSMIEHQAWLKAGANVLLNLALSLIAVFFGAWIGGRIAQH